VTASGQKVQVIGLENIPTGPAVFASNHTSYMDTPVVFASLPFQFRILAKKELWSMPFIGWYLNRSGQIPIDTENPRATLSSLGNGVRALRDGLSVFVFPE
jgi:1-acyl-sn-glycerol-3-phosphate acyltransferase